jgi:hypothetical protein
MLGLMFPCVLAKDQQRLTVPQVQVVALLAISP